jgi:hypothetical protein
MKSLVGKTVHKASSVTIQCILNAILKLAVKECHWILFLVIKVKFLEAIAKKPTDYFDPCLQGMCVVC